MFPTKLIIHTEPNPILRQKAMQIDVKKITSEETKTFLKDFFDLMIKSDGVGIAAPQVGVSLQVCIVSEAGKNHQYLFNPEITWFSKDTISLNEGCLSVPNVYGMVVRPKAIHVKAYNEKGEKIKLKAKGWLSRVIQHEVDHLNGILFIDRAEKLETTSKKSSAL